MNNSINNSKTRIDNSKPALDVNGKGEPSRANYSPDNSVINPNFETTTQIIPKLEQDAKEILTADGYNAFEVTGIIAGIIVVCGVLLIGGWFLVRRQRTEQFHAEFVYSAFEKV